jgi:predicted methyltransferase
LTRSQPPVFTSVTAEQLLRGEKQVSLDLGLSEKEIEKTDKGILLPNREFISYRDLKKISEKEGAVFFVENGEVFQVAVHHDGFLKLLPTEGAPTLEINGVRMHRTAGTTPDADSRLKIELLGIDGGCVLDTCTGLGYTALDALRLGGDLVVSVEIREAVLQIAELNPWSSGIFDDIHVSLVLGNSADLVKGFPNDFFDYVVHDPPLFSHAGYLYASTFYQELYRVMCPKGRLFHYTGEPGSRRGLNLPRGVMKRLRESGFIKLAWEKEALGIVCSKP